MAPKQGNGTKVPIGKNTSNVIIPLYLLRLGSLFLPGCNRKET